MTDGRKAILEIKGLRTQFMLHGSEAKAQKSSARAVTLRKKAETRRERAKEYRLSAKGQDGELRAAKQEAIAREYEHRAAIQNERVAEFMAEENLTFLEKIKLHRSEAKAQKSSARAVTLRKKAETRRERAKEYRLSAKGQDGELRAAKQEAIAREYEHRAAIQNERVAEFRTRSLMFLEKSKLRERTVTALDGTDLTVYENESLGIVGETGCGKSMTAFSVLRLVPPPGKITAGSIKFKGVELTTLTIDEMRGIRGRLISMIFQDPATSLDPVFTIGSQLSEVISLHQGIYDDAALEKKVLDVLKLVRIAAPESVMKQYPHELSGGMKQRVMIALALSCNPALLIADEPTTALDVTIQAQILNLLKDLVKSVGSSMILITHNLGVVAETCDRICIMYAGRIVEIAETLELFENPMHPYAKGLLRAFPKLGEQKDELNVIRGTVPNLMKPFPGCPFVDRCDSAMDRCRVSKPSMVEVRPNHYVNCHLYSGGGESSHGG